MGATASVNPTFSRFFIEKNQKGAVPRVVKYLKDRAWFYPEFKNVDAQTYVKMMSRIGKWITQGVSMELLFDLNKNIVQRIYMIHSLQLGKRGVNLFTILELFRKIQI